MEIKVKVKNEKTKLQVISIGDWVDLYSGECKKIKKGDIGLISLGVAMKLPKGFEAVVVPRSSTFKHFGLVQTNSFGVIDNSYSGDDDIWHFPYVAYKDVVIDTSDRICQFRIQLSQKATMWQKLKWLFSNRIKLKFVSSLGDENRGGFGSTGR